jgi:hypothetical protein
VILPDIDILGPSDRRRVWSAQEKAALLAEVDAEGGKVRLVARRHQISESLLYNWRSARKASAVAMGAAESVEFLQIGLIEGPASSCARLCGLGYGAAQILDALAGQDIAVDTIVICGIAAKARWCARSPPTQPGWRL